MITPLLTERSKLTLTNRSLRFDSLGHFDLHAISLVLGSTSSGLLYLHRVLCSSSRRQSLFPEMCNIRLLIIIILINISCQLIGCQDITFDLDDQIRVEGDHCTLENGTVGICKKLPECHYRLKEIQDSKWTSNSAGRCGFDHLTEIVCCPLRPAKVGLIEGHYCTLENDGVGIYKKLPECPSRLTDVQGGNRTSNCTGNCGFDNVTDIVCCPLPLVKDEGVDCTLENGVTGISKRLLVCRSRFKEMQHVIKTLDSTGRCGFDHLLSVNFCCPRPSGRRGYSRQLAIGSSARRKQFPFMVALGHMTDETDEKASSFVYECGGTLISFEHVLTAAHCVNNIHDSVPVVAHLGNVNLKDNEGAQRIPIGDIVSHPQYRRSMNYNDVAILKLKFRVDITPAVKPICLQTKSVAAIGITQRTHLRVIGWGRTSFESENLSDILIKTPILRVVNSEVCNKSYVEFNRRLPHGIIDSLICVADPNTTRMADACNGDSGGPLLLSSESGYSLIGITAFGMACGTTTPGVYTAIYPFLDWIEEHVWPTLPSTGDSDLY